MNYQVPLQDEAEAKKVSLAVYEQLHHQRDFVPVGARFDILSVSPTRLVLLGNPRFMIQELLLALAIWSGNCNTILPGALMIEQLAEAEQLEDEDAVRLTIEFSSAQTFRPKE